ncbi:cadherin domain-containing protein [Porticoccaceae bacterium]|nr:cadherin domain-containing protein [Porticoccaceae bacterium]
MNIDENIGANQVVYTATADDSADVNDGFTFSLSEGSDSGLSIDTTSGAVTLASNPDYEAQSQYNFAVIATDAAGNVSEAQSVALVINNLDDTAPIITSVDLVNVDEGIGANQVIYTPTADDSADVSDGYTFSLADDSDAALSINIETGAVTLASNPDHETQSQYNFAVIATDAVGNASEAQSVTLDINDLDDTAPIITSDSGVALLQTDSTVIYQVDADDIDSPDNEITYSLVPDTVSVSQVGAIEQVYTANEDGSITLQLFIDDSVTADYLDGLTNYDYVVSYNTQEVSNISYELTSSALNIVNDLVDGQLAVAQVHFPINFDIESGPIAQIDFDLQPGVYSAEFEISNILLPNNATPDDTVDGISSVVRYLGNNGLSIDSASGEVTVTDAPTFISQPFYNFTVTATDAVGNQSESQQVTVTVDDKPVITSGDSSVIDENTAIGEVVYQAVATMPSVFSLGDDSDTDVFAINPETGEVTLKESPDFEVGQQEYVFSVIATDVDDSGNSSDALEVTITVSNVDEVAPEITSAETVDAIDENSGAEQVIYTATAAEIEDISAGVTFSLTEDSDAGAYYRCFNR